MLIDSCFQGAPPVPATFQSHKWSPNAPHQKLPSTSHNRQATVLDHEFRVRELRKKTIFGKKKEKKNKMKKMICQFSQWWKFCAKCLWAQRRLSEKRTSTKESKLKSINAPKHLFFIHYSFPQPRVSSIGFNPWEFLKNIANVASDLNKSKKSAKKKNVLLINVN